MFATANTWPLFGRDWQRLAEFVARQKQVSSAQDDLRSSVGSWRLSVAFSIDAAYCVAAVLGERWCNRGRNHAVICVL
jgi:hypothetical protein